MLIDCGYPQSMNMIGREQLKKYLESQGFTVENLESKQSEISKFKFSETIYDSNEIL